MLHDLLLDLVAIPGPSGDEARVAQRLHRELAPFADEVSMDKMGNVIARKDGADPVRSLMLIAHTDEVSLVVQRVDEVVWFDIVGWIDPACLMGTPVVVLTDNGEVPGVVCSSSAHSPTRDDGGELWIDVGERTADVSVGDPIVFAPNARWLGEHVLASKAIDDRIGCAILVEVARRLEGVPRHTIYFAGVVQEEVGSFGARFVAEKLRPDWAIAIDTTGARDARADRYREVAIGSGPVVRRFQMAQPTSLYPAVVLFPSKRLSKLLIASAQELSLPVSQDAFRHTFTDTALVQLASPETECANLHIPRRYSHSPYEVVDLRDAERAVDILLRTIEKLD
ncbi:MAG: M20/M25/M40 family metallo-hydrolase [Bacteroidetes bacterium]|nr:M20/M25/M40 family metallo-hydrolase [Bacteroidota bacterium]MCL5026094.1 M20/M25/M40 family metallo-hydrolase [Chloroflexota bacterium]